jgi:hypothetical protein
MGGQIVSKFKNILPQFLHLQELLDAFSKIRRKNVTLLEKKGTLCPPDHLLLYTKQYHCPRILDDVFFVCDVQA